jgi:hypothetical protein
MTEPTGAFARRAEPRACARESETGAPAPLPPTDAPASTEAPPPELPARRAVVRSYTPELLAEGRRRFEETDEPITAIAADFGIVPRSFSRLARREGWVRKARAPRDLPVATRLLAQAETLEARALERARNPEGAAPTEEIDDAAAIARLRKAVLDELAVVEALRAKLRREPHSPDDGERTSRTLANLTATFQKLQRMSCGLTAAGQDDDDFPRDIEAFRKELTRRLKAVLGVRDGHGRHVRGDP